MGIKHKDIKSTFSECLSQVYQRLKDFVVSPEAIVQRDRQEEENNANILKNLQQENLEPRPQRQAFDVMYPENKPITPWQQEKKIIPSEVPATRSPILRVGKSEKSILTKWAQNINLKKL